MADIFGREEADYKVVQTLKKHDVWERHQQARIAQSGGVASPMNFNALQAGPPPEYHRANENAQAFGFMTDNLLAIQTMVDEILYTKHRLPDLVHLNYAIPEGAKSYSVRVMDYTGEGDFITNDGTDAPNATASETLVAHGVYLGGIDANWTVEDIRNAMFTGIPLDTESIDAATRGALNHIERVALRGDAKRGFRGLCNLPITGANKVTRIDLGGGKTFDEVAGSDIRDTINDQISGLIEDTAEVFGDVITDNLCVYLPVKQYNRLSTRYIGDDEDRSVMRAILEDNAWTHRTGTRPMFKSVQELKGAAPSDKDRMVIACKDTRVAEVGMPIQPRVLQILNQGRVQTAQVEYKFSSLFVKRPSTIRYVDGI